MLLKDQILLAPKGTTLSGLDHADLLLRQPQDLRKLCAIVKDGLGAYPKNHATLAIWVSDR